MADVSKVTAFITLRSGGRKEFSEPVGDEKNKCKLALLQKALTKLQKETNDALTELVNLEKASNSHTG